MMRFAAGKNDTEWTYPVQFGFMKPILQLAFTQARIDAHMDRDQDGYRFEIQIDDPTGGEMPRFKDGIAKASVALGAALPDAARVHSGAALTVPFGFNANPAKSGEDLSYPSWDTHSAHENDEALGIWKTQFEEAYGPGCALFGDSGVEDAWIGMVHPYQPFQNPSWGAGLHAPKEIQNLFNDQAAMKRLKVVHQRALRELGDVVSQPLDAITKPPLAIYLQAFLGHLFCPDWGDYSLLANDPWK
jgi:hypothetical protein